MDNNNKHYETEQVWEKERMRVQTRCKVHAVGEEEGRQNSQSLIRTRTPSRDIHVYLDTIIHLAEEEYANKNIESKCKKEKGYFCSVC